MSLRLKQEDDTEIRYIDYGRMSEIDDGRRVFYNTREWYECLRGIKRLGYKLHMITPKICGATPPKARRRIS